MWINITDGIEKNQYEAEFEIFNYCGDFKFRMFRDESFDIYDVQAYTSEGDDHIMSSTQLDGLHYWLQELINEKGICYDNGYSYHEWDEHAINGL